MSTTKDMSHLETFPEEPRCPHCGEKEGAADEIERLERAVDQEKLVHLDFIGELQEKIERLEGYIARPPTARAAEYCQGYDLLKAKVERLEGALRTVDLSNTRLHLENQRLEAALEVCNQMVLEVSHAQQCGPGWYTRGEDGLRAQVDMWVRKASTAIREALDNAG